MSPHVSSHLPQPPQFEVADVFRQFGAAFLKRGPITAEQYKVLGVLQSCRKPVLGGRKVVCDHCQLPSILYNSCRNRHCPTCQFVARNRWVAKQMQDLLPVSYYHVVVTLPHSLNPWVESNKKRLLNELFRTVNDVFRAFARDPQWRLEGDLGVLSIIHTWTQTLEPHYHLHNLIPAGVLRSDGTWKAGRSGFLFGQRAVGKAIRARFLKGLRRLDRKEPLTRPSYGIRSLSQLVKKLWSQQWVLDIRKPFGGPEQVLKYLGRYTHRVAISNHRIVDMDQTHVTFSYLDRRKRNQKPQRKTLALKGEDFIKRFQYHVLPSGFQKIRYFGFLARNHKAEKLRQIRSQMNENEQEATRTETDEPKPPEEQPPFCPHCGGGPLILVDRIPRQEVRKLPLTA